MWVSECCLCCVSVIAWHWLVFGKQSQEKFWVLCVKWGHFRLLHKPVHTICGERFNPNQTCWNSTFISTVLTSHVASCQNDSGAWRKAPNDELKKNIISASSSSCSVPDPVQGRIIPTVWHCSPQQWDLWRGNCNWQMGREEKRALLPGRGIEGWTKANIWQGRRRTQQLDLTSWWTVIAFESLLWCLQRETLALTKKVMSGNERQWVREVERGDEDADNASQTQTEKEKGRRESKSSCSRAESEAEKVPGWRGSIRGVGWRETLSVCGHW